MDWIRAVLNRVWPGRNSHRTLTTAIDDLHQATAAMNAQTRRMERTTEVVRRIAMEDEDAVRRVLD